MTFSTLDISLSEFILFWKMKKRCLSVSLLIETFYLEYNQSLIYMVLNEKYKLINFKTDN